MIERAETSTGWVELARVVGSDEEIAQVARTSYGPSGRAVRDDRALVAYLVEHRHTGPLEFAQTWWRIQAPIYVARQWLRHRTASVNEHSLRYSGPLHLEGPSSPASWDVLADEDRLDLTERLTDLDAAAREHYERAIAAGAKRETARAFLLCSEPTRWMWRIDLHNLLHFLALRRAPDAQPEIREYADAMERMIAPYFPAAIGAWHNFCVGGISLAADEIPILRAVLRGVPLEDAIPAGFGARRERALRAKLDRIAGMG